MLIAGFKASLVVWYFMHVKYQSHLTKLTVATGLFFLDHPARDVADRLRVEGRFHGRRPQPVNPDAVIEQVAR